MNHLAYTCALALIAVSITACSSTKSPSELESIQNTEGFYSQSIFYTGSSSRYHYFEQWRLLGDSTWLHDDNDSHRTFQVSRSKLPIPTDWLFSHSDYKGEDDERRVRCRIHTTPSLYVERRSKPQSKRHDPDDYEIRQTGEHEYSIFKKVKQP